MLLKRLNLNTVFNQISAAALKHINTENNNTVVKIMLCRLQHSNKRRHRISAAFEAWKFL